MTFPSQQLYFSDISLIFFVKRPGCKNSIKMNLLSYSLPLYRLYLKSIISLRLDTVSTDGRGCMSAVMKTGLEQNHA